METLRPKIDSCKTGAALRLWYWTKYELVAEARRRGLPTSGGKFDILDRICASVDGIPIVATKTNTTSRFDWHKGPVGRETLITDNYKNTQCVRRFFQAELGAGFRFTIPLMDWLRANTGKNMGDAVSAAQALYAQSAVPGFKSQIKPHNQWNAYQRAFLADNPDLGLPESRKAWAKKRGQPSRDGRHIYARSDLDL
jgi:hypothetical protein